MSGKLRDPDLPPGAVVRIDAETGEGIRNDGKRLKPAAKNPWYVLATIAGEQPSGRDQSFGRLLGLFTAYENDLHTRNRRFWNGWACSRMSQEERAELAERMGLPVEELAPWSKEERAKVEAEFADRLGPGIPIPEPATERIDFLDTCFRLPFAFQKCVIPGPSRFAGAHFSAASIFDAAVFLRCSGFESATFHGVAKFDCAAFTNGVSFDKATFSGDASFSGAAFFLNCGFDAAVFSGRAVFWDATFEGQAQFRGTNFGGDAEFWSSVFNGGAWFVGAALDATGRFSGAIFRGPALFDQVTFRGDAEFSDGAFEGPTKFTGARFSGAVPTFYNRRFHQDTDITTDKAFWPPVTEENARDSKRAYTRLRQIMAELHKPDAEAFFGRQELRCDEVLDKGLSKWVSRAYGMLSDYGFSFTRPALALAGMIGFLWPLYGSWLKHGAGQEGAILSGLGLSFANTFPYLGFQRLYFDVDVIRAFPWWLKLLGGFQTVAGGVLLFLLLLGLRNRFRLR
ncbi:Pentapeptide repeat-containing protein [Meinhardsimonia xiamenensis]|jgi:hypothetical protein|uniref:Pentapeptide repeat-containing protein n=1 Tax=Meinhardsimonia xiamenensis TaxID=990712 RepID=A0A1G9FNC6_9RHOB|nr:pentapeptide repeat-containing protein [Meinhardsimonia xiamenensis]PRX37757.1 pentapeptide repeat protein [Meinhardsimonia xiamenensis]SDK89938.1 Pentapeptide repeat-containing protein [Meinhardsimonia xiamenensis]